jgi:hypothetical protein
MDIGVQNYSELFEGLDCGLYEVSIIVLEVSVKIMKNQNFFSALLYL